MLNRIFYYLSRSVLVGGACCAGLIGDAFAGDDDQIVVLNAATETNEHDNFEANFEQWVFAGSPSAAVGRKRMEAQAKLQIGEIERSCRLSSEQKSRLELAARGDFERFNEQAEALRRKFAGMNIHDNEKMNQFWQELQPLQMRQSRGVGGPDTLLTKAIARTLDEEQTKELDAGQSERRRFRYEASVAIAVHTLETTAPLTSEQREKLTQMLLALPLPKTFGQMDQWVVTYRLSILSSQPAVKEILEARQWQALAQPLAQAKGYKQHLIELGHAAEDLDIKAAPAASSAEAKP
ncbi:MAG TPA: hypothetical protein VGI40_01675 [Pirellulaceae bacterium]|jgi:hypothetical protein